MTTTTLLDNSANEFAAFSTILSGFDEEYVSPNRKSKSSFSLSSPTAKKNVAESFSSPSPQAGRGRGRGKGYNNYDPDEPLDVLQEMNQMLEAAERELYQKSTHLCSRSVRNVRRLGVSIGTGFNGERKSNETRRGGGIEKTVG
jgi:hypothetical protein